MVKKVRKNKLKPLSFFLSRIGKRIYRDYGGCDCATCHEVVKNGLIIADEEHAEYVFATQNEFEACGVYLNYRDFL